uniref:DHC_N2 domain-containing protein n=1 Tax=Caenorhabditis tropicalis TaxID=1561998 RepID=A0A1I7T1F5_9PELO
MYEIGFGNIYHPKCHGISCRDIPRDLEYNNRKLVHHNHQGKRIKKQNGRLLFSKGVEIEGKQIKKPKETSSIRNIIRTTVTNFESNDILHEECLPSFPAWKGQVESLSEKLKDGGLETTLKELNINWPKWIREAAEAYLSKDEFRVPCIGRSPWRHTMVQNTDKISKQLQLKNKIITMFFEKYRERCLIDCSFLLSENGRSVSELEKQLKDFVLHTKRILSFEWPMAVANLMLDEGPSWIPLFVTSTSHTVFNAVAATMARLLYDVVNENINRVKTFFDLDDRAKLIIILHEDEKEFDYWHRINILLDLCKIPRVDHKIYPRMFTEAWIDVRNWFDSQSIVFKPLPQPFEMLNSRKLQVQEMLNSFEKDPEDVEFWEKIAKEILDIREQILKQGTRVLKGFIIYDSRDIKKRSLAKITELEDKSKQIILSRLIEKNTKIREVFTRCSAKLFRNDVLVQLRNIEEVQNELPSIKEKIQIVGNAYRIYMEYFTMPDYDIRQFYEISRLGLKLEQLVNFVWDRINHERQWITKQVSEQTSKNYYECEMIEKEWLDCLKKYRSAVRINEVQKVQIKMGNLEERSSILKGKDEKLIGQRSLLGLPSSPIDCIRIAKVCEFFSKLSTLHFKTLLHHESCLRMRISDVDHNFLVSETEHLQAEKDSLTEKAIAINEHVTTSNEALLKIENVLSEFEKLLPVLGAISCQAMKDRHWKMILQDSETSVKVEGNPLVSELLEMNFIEKADKFEQVGAQAEKERVLETSIDKMRSQWKSATFVTHQGGELLTTELNVQMQAHLARSQTILSSPHAFSILDHIRHWLDTLLNLNTFVHLYKRCDIRWKKIEGVFSTEDIAYQMPHEFRTFKKISLRWLHINNQITEERPILEQMDLVQQLNIDLSELEVLFGRMENGFHAYLRKKRAVFPRLFALSDELVLSLICDSREPANCKSYIPLLFPSLITFDQNTKMEIISVSTKSETIPLVKPVNVNLSKRHVEKWMHELDAQIKYTLRTRIRLLIEKMNYKMSPVESILIEPIQVASVYLKIAFTWQMENSMKQNSMTILANELKMCIRDCQHAIIHKQERREFLPVLYHIYKSATHLVNKFINEQVIFIDDYRWMIQLRYYWHMENVFIRIGTVSTRYDYEVQGNNYLLDHKLIDEAVKTFIYMNHFGFNGKTIEMDMKLAREISGALGKPFSICDTKKETDCKMLIEGSLLFGGNNKKLLENLLQLNVSLGKPKKSPSPSRTPKSSDIPRKLIDTDPPEIKEKTNDLLELLQNNQVVVVFGESLSGKSRVISKAAKIKAADVEIEFGSWEDIQVFGESLKNMRRPNKWIVIDGFMSEKTQQWVHRLTNENTIFPWRELPIIANCERVIIETDQLTDDLKQLPMVLIDNIDDFGNETTLEQTEKQRIDEVLSLFSEFKFKKFELIRKIEGLKRLITTNSEKVFEHLLSMSLLSFMPVHHLMSNLFFKSESDLHEFYKNVPYSSGWYTHKEAMEIPFSHFYMIHSIGLILHSDFIPFLVCPPCQEFNVFLSRLQTELDSLGWHTITMSIDKNVTIEEIKQFVDNCSIMFATLELSERNKRIRCDSVILSPSDAKNINMIEKITKANYGHVLIVGNDIGKSMDALRVSTELNKQVIYTNQGIKSIEEWRELMDRVLRDCLIDGKETVLGITINPNEFEVVEAILVDATCICSYKLIPMRYLTRLMLSEFGEKHTLEGKGIWEMLENKLSALKISLVLPSSDFSWFMNCHRTLLSMLILVWWGDPSKREQEQEILDELHNSELFSKQQIDQIMKVIEELIGLKLIETRAEKLKMQSTIIKLARKRKEEVRRTMSKYEKGMEKMKRAEEQVAGMQGELLRLQPQLVRTSIETSMLMSTIEKETIDVENAREVVAANENKANEAATKAQSLKAESEAELASAIPALESAVEALETMTQSDVSSLKTMRFPPYAVRLCMEAVCILLGVKPAKITNEIGEIVNDYWVSGQKLLSDIHFLAKIRSFARDSMSKKTMKLIREKYLSKEEFDPENVKQCSLAAEGLCRWVLAIDMYNQISKIVEPKRERLRKAEVLVKQHLKQLEVKRKALLKVTEKLQGLSDQFSQMCQKKQELESQISSCEVRMERAERLVQALGGEKDKWKSKITDILHEDSLSVPYSVGSALASHVLGGLPIDQRERELRKTMRLLFPKVEVTIPCDMKTLVMLVDDPIFFVNDDDRAIEFLKYKFERVVVSNEWKETERQQCLTANSVFLLELCEENLKIGEEIEEAEYYSQMEEEIVGHYLKKMLKKTFEVIKIGNTQHEVNKNFRVFFRTQKNDLKLKSSIRIDNEFSDEELRRDICEKMGSVNWFETLSHFNEMVESRNKDIAMMEKTENEMLDLLGRSKDLDDERAIDLLAEARNLQASVTARNKEITEVTIYTFKGLASKQKYLQIETSLRSIETKMSECIDYSMKVIKMCYSLHLLDPFYRISLSSLVSVLQTKLIDSIAEVRPKEINRKISELYWDFLCHLLAWEDKIIVHHLLFHNLDYKVEKLDMEIKDRLSMDSFMNFSTFILKSEPKQLILLKYDSEVYTTILQFGQVTRNANWRVYTILDHVILKLEKLIDEPIWLLLNVNESDQITIGKLKIIMEKLKSFPIVHLSFRIIVSYSNEIECSDELINLTFHRFYFSSSASLTQQTRRILANLSIRTSLDKSEERQRIQIIRLLSFHYGLKLRKVFDSEFHVIVDDADLLAMLKLYQELRNLSDQPNEIQDAMKVRTCVIEPIYHPKTTCPVERNIINAMIQWIVEANLSIPADTLLRNIIREDNHNFVRNLMRIILISEFRKIFHTLCNHMMTVFYVDSMLEFLKNIAHG